MPLTTEELELIKYTHDMVKYLERWFKKLDRENRDNLFAMSKRSDHILTMKVKGIYSMQEAVTLYSMNAPKRITEENIMLIISASEGLYNIVIKDKFVIQLNTKVNKIEVRMSDISTLYGTHVLYVPPYTISAKEIVETIMHDLHKGE